MRQVIEAISGLHDLLKRKYEEYSILNREAQSVIERCAAQKKDLDKRESAVAVKEEKIGLIDKAREIRAEADKIKAEAEMLLSMSRDERKTVIEWCDAEKRKAAQAIKDMESFINALKDREERLKYDRKMLEEEKLNFKNTIIKSFDRK